MRGIRGVYSSADDVFFAAPAKRQIASRQTVGNLARRDAPGHTTSTSRGPIRYTNPKRERGYRCAPR